MKVTVQCPECGASAEVPPEAVGKRVSCLKCGHLFVSTEEGGTREEGAPVAGAAIPYGTRLDDPSSAFEQSPAKGKKVFGPSGVGRIVGGIIAFTIAVDIASFFGDWDLTLLTKTLMLSFLFFLLKFSIILTE